MPFGLKNTGATYQRLVNKMFADQINLTIEVYVDDMLVKSLVPSDDVTHLSQMFAILRAYQMKLNLKKYSFGVNSGKFLRYMISHRGIEGNSQKVKAILDLQSPSKVKQVQSLIGNVVALSQFISRSTNKCKPFFEIMKKNKTLNGMDNISEPFKS